MHNTNMYIQNDWSTEDLQLKCTYGMYLNTIIYIWRIKQILTFVYVALLACGDGVYYKS